MNSAHKFRFGVIAKAARPADDFAAYAKRIEDLGFSTMFIPDHFVDHPLAPIPAAMAAAMATKTLRVGTLVLGNDYRHPVVLANEAATIDLLSGGRLELGLGAGWMTVDYEKGGFQLDPPSVRIARLDESLTVMKGLWADGPFSFHGDHYSIDELDGDPKPSQKPHPPLIVGGGGPKILAVAAKHAQIVGINANLRAGVGEPPDSVHSLTAAATDDKLRWLRDAAGSGFDDLDIQTLTGFVHVTDDRESIARGMATAFGVDVSVALETPAALVGTVEEIVEEVQRRRDRWQMNYVVVDETFLDAFAPVVDRLAGS
ncbi:MAG: TIGR03621 family F420-dependent LLM class oxidoreductase [Actinomycetes bacterium]